MRPSYIIDFLQQVPQCPLGEAADILVPSTSNVREATPHASMMSSTDLDTQLFLTPFSLGTEELLRRKRKSPSVRVTFDQVYILSSLPSFYTTICCTTYYTVSTSFPRLYTGEIFLKTKMENVPDFKRLCRIVELWSWKN